MNYAFDPADPLYAPIVNLLKCGAEIRDDTEDMLVIEKDGLFVGAGHCDKSESFRGALMALCLEPDVAKDMLEAGMFESMHPVIQYSCTKDSIDVVIPGGLEIRQLTEADIPFVCTHYEHPSATPKHIGERVKEYMIGAFIGDQCVGFAGIHEEDSIGMVVVLPEYRQRGIAKALVQSLIRYQLERGHIPYTHVRPHNIISANLQTGIGYAAAPHLCAWLCKDSLYRAKKLV